MQDKHEKFGGFYGPHQSGTTPMNIGVSTTEIQNDNFASVYYYLLTGITLLIAVFLFLPRVSVG